MLFLYCVVAFVYFALMLPLCVLGDVTNTRQSTGGPWADMQDAFTQRINELKRFMHLRVEGQ